MRFRLALVSTVLVTAAPAVKVSPALLTYAFQEGAPTIPATQSLAVTPPSGNVALPVTVRSGGSRWLILSPVSGSTPLTVRVAVNPSTLPIGVYSEAITLSSDASGEPVTVPVTLTVRGAPSDIRSSHTSFSVSHRLDAPRPEPVQTFLTTTGGLLSFSAAVTGTKWLRISPSSGAVFPGFRTPLTLSVDPTGLVPGTYKGTAVISSADAVTKSTPLTVNLVIQPGEPSVSGIWPQRVTRGSPDLTLTVNGGGFFPNTLVRIGTTALKADVLGANAMTVVIPSSFLANPGTVILTVSNPDPGGGAAAPVALHVMPPGPILGAVVNSASQAAGGFAPGTVVTLYGTGLGPETLTVFDNSRPQVPTTLGGTRVLLDTLPLPIIYTSPRQVSVALPNVMDTQSPFQLRVEYNDVFSEPVSLAAVPASPGIFTVTGAGAGQAAAIQYNLTKGDVALNSDKNPASKGDILVFYVTGLGPSLPIPPDGLIPQAASRFSVPDVAVRVGEVTAEVLYAGASPGLVAGILQINAKLPENVPVGKAVPLTVRLGTAASQAGVTIHIK